MGYDSDIIAFKKKSLENRKEVFPDSSFEDLYSGYLVDLIYPNTCDVSEDEKARWISSPRRGIFNEFFSGNFGNGEVKIIDEDTYLRFYNWIETKLKNTTLYDFIENEKEEGYIDSLLCTYKNMRDKKIDFETEFVIFEHDW